MNTGSDAGAYVMIFSLLVIAGVAIIIALARWIFRINDIVSRLDSVVELLRKT